MQVRHLSGYGGAALEFFKSLSRFRIDLVTGASMLLMSVLHSVAELIGCWTGQISALPKLRLLLWNEGQTLVRAGLSVQLQNWEKDTFTGDSR